MKFSLVFFFVHLACSSCYSLHKEDEDVQNDNTRRLALVMELLDLNHPNYLTEVSLSMNFVLYFKLCQVRNLLISVFSFQPSAIEAKQTGNIFIFPDWFT